MTDIERFWDKTAVKYSAMPTKDVPAYEKTMERTRSYLSENDAALELGCGTGSTALLLSGSVRHITVSDVSSKMIGIGRQKAKDQGVDNVDFMQSDVFGAPLNGRTFDVVMAFNLLHLIKDTPAAMARVRDLLKPGGLFISKSVCLSDSKRLLRVPLFVMEKIGLAPYVRFLKTTELDAFVRDGGFQIIETGDYPASPPSHFIVARKV